MVTCTPLDVHYRFATFIEGACNSSALRTAMFVAEVPGQGCNPLLIAGASGLGATHLMQAMAHDLPQRNARARVVYVSCEHWLKQFTGSVRTNSLDRFRANCLNTDALLIDGLGYLTSRQCSHDQLSLLCAMVEASKQIVISGGRDSNTDGLLTLFGERFASASSVVLGIPDQTTRKAILMYKAPQLGLLLSEEAAGLIAQPTYTNIRELEGALNRMSFSARRLGLPVAPKHSALCGGYQ